MRDLNFLKEVLIEIKKFSGQRVWYETNGFDTKDVKHAFRDIEREFTPSAAIRLAFAMGWEAHKLALAKAIADA